MRIAILLPSFLPVTGGAEIGAFELACRLRARGHEAVVITPQLDPRWPVREVINPVEVRRFPIPRGVPGRGMLAPVIAGYLALGPLLRDLRPDLVNMHYLLTTGLGGQFWSSRLGIPTVLTLIGMDVYDPLYRPPALLRVLMRLAARRSDVVTCISTFVREIVAREYLPSGAPPPTVVPYGVDVKRFYPGVAGGRVREQFGVRPGEKLVLTVQRLYPRKGVQHFVRAASLVFRECPATRFLVVGDGPEQGALMALAQSLGLQGRLMFAGAVENAALPPFYAASDVFAFHTLHEGLGIVLLEAIASGRPVITTAAGGTVDVIRDGKNGLVVPPGDERAFAGAVIRLLRDEGTSRLLATTGREIAETEYDWERVADRYLEVFLLAARRKECG